MAASSKIVRRAADFGKPVIRCLNWSRRLPSSLSHAPSASVFSLRRAVHSSAYDKNPEEQICPTVVPDHVIQPLSENYWAPHPKTGVFGPPSEHTAPTGTSTGAAAAAGAGTEEGSVLELKAWFRHNDVEDLEKPHLL